MIKNSKQAWEVGETVKAGFVSAVVKAKCFTPGDGLPDLYICTNVAGDKLYMFVPYHGLTRISEEEARNAISVHKRHTERLAAMAAANFDARRAIDALFA